MQKTEAVDRRGLLGRIFRSRREQRAAPDINVAEPVRRLTVEGHEIEVTREFKVPASLDQFSTYVARSNEGWKIVSVDPQRKEEEKEIKLGEAWVIDPSNKVTVEDAIKIQSQLVEGGWADGQAYVPSPELKEEQRDIRDRYAKTNYTKAS